MKSKTKEKVVKSAGDLDGFPNQLFHEINL